ncbi:MAG: hypothetical protein II817_01375 [Bacteroidales bacterium]|nr:hypothetical protein [Bacteroidales bacterium]
MKIIEYKKIYNYLVDTEKVKIWEAIHIIFKIRKMAPDILLEVKKFIDDNSYISSYHVNQVSYDELVSEDALYPMRPIQAFLMLDWIKRDPVTAINFMAAEVFKSPIPELSDEEKKTLNEAIARLDELDGENKGKTVPETLNDLSEEEKSDIVIEDAMMDMK